MDKKLLIAITVVLVVGVWVVGDWAQAGTCPQAQGAHACKGAHASADTPPGCGAHSPCAPASACGDMKGCEDCPMAGKDHSHSEATGSAACAGCEHGGEDGACARQSERGQPGMGGHKGAHRPGVEVVRAIAGGSVKLNYHSQRRAGGSLILELSVLDPEGNTMDGAVVTGFVYPDGNPAAGRGAAFSATSRDSQMAWVQPPAGNSLEVAVRVKRAGAADELLFFGLEPEPKPQHTGRGCHGMQ